MSKGIPGMTYLPKLNLVHVAGSNATIRAFRQVLSRVQKMQEDQVQDSTLTNEVISGNSMYYTSDWDITSTGAVASTGTVTLASAIAGDTVTVNGLLYTGVAGAKANNTEFSIDTSDTAAATDLADSITNDTRTGLNGDVTASSALGVVTITQSVTGQFGNQTPLSSSNGTRAAVSGAYLTGGADPDTYTLVFNSEDNPELYSINPPGMTQRRALDIAFTGATFTFSIRSLLSVLNWIERWAEKYVYSRYLETKATGTVTCASVLAGDTVTINGLVYTAVSGAKADNTEFSIDTSDTACALDLADSINNDTRTGTLGDVSASADTGVVTLTSDQLGAVGNAVTLVSSNGTRLAVSGATFSGGSDYADGTYTDAIFKGATPNETFVWTVVKLGDVYTLTSTANS